MNPKPGWQTTEFWLTLSMQVVSMLVLLNVVPSTDADTVNSTLNTLILSGFAVGGAAWSLVKYIGERSSLKQAHLEAEYTEVK